MLAPARFAGLVRIRSEVVDDWVPEMRRCEQPGE